MNETQATGVLIALFALRCIVPLVITLALGYLMNRLVDRWEAEDAQMQETPAKPQIVPQPMPSPQPSISSKLPCWLVIGCKQEQRANCPAFQQKAIPCWLARLRMEGVMPAGCPDCPVYRQAHA